MTIKELIESNSFIGDITIDIRGRSKTVTPGFENQQTFSQLEQDWHIGYEEGKKPPYPSEKGIYIEKSINKYDDGEDYYDLTVSRIPDEVMNLYVVSWSVWKSYRSFGDSHYNNHDMQHINITAWTDETKEMYEQQEELKKLEKAAAREKRKAEKEQGKQDPDQIDMNEWLRTEKY